MADRKTSDTVLIHRIAGAATGQCIDALKHDLPDDRVTRALATALANALDENTSLLLDMGVQAEELNPKVAD